jgi:argininosuccinate synthase
MVLWMRVVLAYSGGLDTTTCIVWLREKYGSEVVTVTVDVGQEEDFEEVERRAYRAGAAKHYTIDAKEEFVREYIFPAIKMNALYEGAYPLSTALARPLIAKKVLEVAEKEGADAVAHGSTSKGNDQVRFDLTIRALNPSIRIITPARSWGMTRSEELEYLRIRGIDVPSQNKRYSIDDNLWGRSIEGGELDDPSQSPLEDAFKWTRSPEKAPDKHQILEIEFKEGIPIGIDGEILDPVRLISTLNTVGGVHGVGRIDHLENRLVGFKSREVYEAPAATILIKTHEDLEKSVLTPRELRVKKMLEPIWSDLVYNGLWFEPARTAIEALANEMNKWVTGSVRVKLYKGSMSIVSRKSPYIAYSQEIASYEKGWYPSEEKAVGFIEIWGMHTLTALRVRGLALQRTSPR